MRKDYKILWAPPSIGNEETQSVEKVMNSNWMTQGKVTEKLENAIVKETNSKFAVVVNNGTSALICALLANNIGPGDEVILPSFTFVATANAVLSVGAKPILVDSDKETFNTTVKLVEKKITKKTKAIIPVDVGGMPINIEDFQELAMKKNLILIQDSAESLGAKYKNKKIGEFGQTAIFSFHMAKIITSVEGGAIITNQKEIADRIKLIRSHGDIGGYDSQCFGLNFRISDIHSAIALEQIKKIDKFLKHRNRLVRIYKEELSNVRFQKIPEYVTLHPHMLFSVLFNSKIRNYIINSLSKSGIETRICWRPVHLQKYFSSQKNYKLPNAEHIFSKIINLPMGNGLTENQVIETTKSINKALKEF